MLIQAEFLSLILDQLVEVHAGYKLCPPCVTQVLVHAHPQASSGWVVGDVSTLHFLQDFFWQIFQGLVCSINWWAPTALLMRKRASLFASGVPLDGHLKSHLPWNLPQPRLA